MGKYYRLLATVLMLALTGCNSIPPDEFAQVQMMKPFKLHKTESINLNYLLFLPENYQAKSGKAWPLILFLHGSGERGKDVWQTAVHGPARYIAQHPDFPFIFASPQCAAGQHWSNDSLLPLLNEITKKYKVDTARIYLTGSSMGGYGTWELGLSYPEKFAALAPICGGGQMITLILASREKPQALKTLPVWAFHGAKDPVVPIEETQRMIDALKKLGVKETKFTIYPEAGHNSWTKSYNDPKLYEWFLEHERKSSSK
jgi:predicted peptidase